MQGEIYSTIQKFCDFVSDHRLRPHDDFSNQAALNFLVTHLKAARDTFKYVICNSGVATFGQRLDQVTKQLTEFRGRKYLFLRAAYDAKSFPLIEECVSPGGTLRLRPRRKSTSTLAEETFDTIKKEHNVSFDEYHLRAFWNEMNGYIQDGTLQSIRTLMKEGKSDEECWERYLRQCNIVGSSLNRCQKDTWGCSSVYHDRPHDLATRQAGKLCIRALDLIKSLGTELHKEKAPDEDRKAYLRAKPKKKKSEDEPRKEKSEKETCIVN